MGEEGVTLNDIIHVFLMHQMFILWAPKMYLCVCFVSRHISVIISYQKLLSFFFQLLQFLRYRQNVFCLFMHFSSVLVYIINVCICIIVDQSLLIILSILSLIYNVYISSICVFKFITYFSLYVYKYWLYHRNDYITVKSLSFCIQ